MQNIKNLRGFTLVELVVVICIIGILYAIAYPSYMKTVRKTNRSEAKSELSDAAQRFQRCYTINGKFDTSPNGNCPVFDQLTNGGAITTTPSGFYQIKLETSSPAISATKFKLIATAIKAPQTQDTVDNCNVLKLDQNGVKEPSVCW